MFRSTRSLWTLLALSALGVGYVQGEPERTAAPEPLEVLIRQLDHPDFRKRNEAELRLLELGTGNLAALEAAALEGSAERKYRAQRLVGSLRELRARQQIEALEDDPWLVGGAITEVWEVFHDVVGDSPSAQGLFLHMMKSDPQLTLAPAETPAIERALLEARCTELRNYQQLVRSEPVRVGHAASILFVTLVCRQNPSLQTVSVANSVLDSPLVMEALHDRRSGPALRALLAHWIMREGLVSAHSRLMLAARYDIPAGVVPAREMISEGALKTSQPQYPILFLARYSGLDALPDLERLLSVTKVIANSTQETDRGPVTFSTQVRDVALIGLLHITQQDPADYGFQRLRPDSRFLYSPTTIGFEDDAQRLKALAHWQEWRARNVQGDLKPWPDASEGTAL